MYYFHATINSCFEGTANNSWDAIYFDFIIQFISISGTKNPQKNTAGTLTSDIKTLLFFRVAITGVIYLILTSLYKEVVLNPCIITEEKRSVFSRTIVSM